MNHLLGVTGIAAASNKPSPLGGLLLPALLFVAMYFLLIRPSRRRAMQAQKVRSQLEVGQRIVTRGGLLGTVTEVTDDGFGLQVADGVTLQFVRGALDHVIPEAIAPEESSPDHPTTDDGSRPNED